MIFVGWCQIPIDRIGVSTHNSADLCCTAAKFRHLRRNVMYRMICFMLILLLAPAFAAAAEQPTIESLTPLAQQYMYIHSRYSSFEVEAVEVEGLWEALEIQILEVRLFGMFNSPVESVYLLYHHGIVEYLPGTTGGLGPLSAVVVDDQLYYSYSWGYGIHRSCLVQLSVKDEELTLVHWEANTARDVFVTVVDGRVQVQTGGFQEFNSWSAGTRVGWLKLKTVGLIKKSSLVIVDDDGDEISSILGDCVELVYAPSRWIEMNADDQEHIPIRYSFNTSELSRFFQSELINADLSLNAICISNDETLDQAFIEREPRECWITQAHDEEDHVAALFSIRE